LFEESAEILAQHKHSHPALYFATLNNYAAYLINVRDFARAQPILEQLLEIVALLKQTDQVSGDADLHFMKLILHLNLVILFVQLHELDEAANHGLEGDAVFEKLIPTQQAQINDFYRLTCARLRHAQGRLVDACRELERVRNPEPASLPLRAKLSLTRQEFSQAEQLLRKWLDAYRRVGALHRPESIEINLDLAESLFGQGKHDDAFTALQDARVLVADFAVAPWPAWYQALASWRQRAQELGRTATVASLEADLQARTSVVEQGITISAKLRAANCFRD
jgi:tetratricopeptide (TPR) repeat protein